MENGGYAIIEFYHNWCEPSLQYARRLVQDYSNDFMRVFRTDKIDKNYGSSQITDRNSFVALFYPTEILAYTTVKGQKGKSDLLILRGFIAGLPKKEPVNVSIWASEGSKELKKINNIVKNSIENGSECAMRLLLTKNTKGSQIFYNHEIGMPHDDKNVLIIYAKMEVVLTARVSQSTIDHFVKPPQQSKLDDFLPMKRDEKD